MKQTRKLVYYLAVQDGRYDEREFNSHKEAMRAFKAIKPATARMGICIMTRWKNETHQ